MSTASALGKSGVPRSAQSRYAARSHLLNERASPMVHVAVIMICSVVSLDEGVRNASFVLQVFVVELSWALVNQIVRATS